MKSKNNIDKLIEDLDEANVTGDVAGYETPFAFSDGSKEDEEEKYLKALLGEKPNQPATETDEIKSLSYLISLMQTDK